MMVLKDLTNSSIARQNILNNTYAVEEIQKAVGIEGVVFDSRFRFLKGQIAAFFEVDERTIERYLEIFENELMVNGYEVLRGKRLKEFILACLKPGVGDMNVAHKTRNLGVFNFRAPDPATEYQLATTLVSQNGNVAIYIVHISCPSVNPFYKNFILCVFVLCGEKK